MTEKKSIPTESEQASLALKLARRTGRTFEQALEMIRALVRTRKVRNEVVQKP